MFPLAVSTYPTPKPQANTDLLFCYHIDLSSSEFCINEVTWYTLFCLDSFTQHSVFEIHPLLHESVIGYFFLQNGIPLYKYTTVGSIIHLMMDI